MSKFNVLYIIGIVLSNVLIASDCPECIEPSPSACRRVGTGQAKFLWASGDNVGSSITLTSGTCGQGGEGATGYIFMHTNTHHAICNGDTVCDDGLGEKQTIAIIRVSGNQKAYANILGSIGFTGDKVYTGMYGNTYYKGIGVTQTNCDYSVELSGASAARIKVSAGVSQCDPKYSSGRFQIIVKFYQVLGKQGSEDSYTLLATTKGSISVKNNNSRDFNPVSFVPDFRDKSMMDMKEIVRNYSEEGGQSTWMIPYNGQDWQSDGCTRQQGWCGPWGGASSLLVPSSETFSRVKYPGMEASVQGQPNYMKDSGWNYELSGNRLVYNMGNQGKMYYHLEAASSGSTRVRTVEACESNQSAGDGEIQWTITYDELDRIKYIQNASYTDPNSPPDCNDIAHSTQCYVYEYTEDSENPVITFKTRPTTTSQWQDSRQWQVEFDAEGRAIKYQDGCGGCSGGTGNFEHIAYHPDFEDEILWRKNADGTVLVENTIEAFEFGQYEPAGWIYVPDSGFERQEVDLHDCEEFDNPNEYSGWQHNGASPTVEICDPNSSQYLSFTAEEDAIFQELYPIGANTRYRLSIKLRAHTGQADSFAGIHLWAVRPGATDEDLEAVYLSDPNMMQEGQWIPYTFEWDSTDRPDLVFDPSSSLDPWRLKIELIGKKVDMDDVQLSTAIWVGGQTKPLITEQRTYAQGYDDPQTSIQRTYTSNRETDVYQMIERQYVNAGSAECRVVVYDYTDDSFTTLAKQTEYSELGTPTALPSGDNFDTVYSGNDPNAFYLAAYPNGKRADFERYEHGHLIESYIVDLENDCNSLKEQFQYAEFPWQDSGEWKLQKHINARGGITEYEYYTELQWLGLLKKQTDPNTAAGRQVTEYFYDGARRLLRQVQKLDSERNITTLYTYNPNTGYLDAESVNGITTRYFYNHFGQLIRQINPDGVISGKSYGLGGELLSEFVISKNTADPNGIDSSLTLISQTRYTYTADGQIELVGRYNVNDEFACQADMITNPENWIISKYEYYADGKRKKVIEDYGIGRHNLTTEYFYNLRGEVEKIVYPTGKWVKTIRNGRGQVILEQTGYGTDNIILESAYDYDANGNLCWQKNADGTELCFTYDNYDQLKRTYQGSLTGSYTENFYNNAGDIIREIVCEADGTMLSDRRMDYDTVGHIIYERVCAEPNTLDDLNDNITHYIYDIAENLVRQVNAGLTNSNPGSTADPNDIVTQYVYDQNGRNIQTVDPKGFIRSTFYTAGGLPELIVDPNDPADPNAFKTMNFYSYGRLDKSIDPMGHYTVYLYNSLNQVIRRAVYDCNGTLDNLQDDFAVRQQRMEYDRLGNVNRQAVMADPQSEGAIVPGVDLVTDFIYQNGLLYQQKSYYGDTAAEAVTTYYYDSIGRRERVVDPENNEEAIFYYADGIKDALVEKVQQREVNSLNPQDWYIITTFYNYDDFGRVYQEMLDSDGDGYKDSTDQTTTYTYDALNRPKTQTVNNGVVAFLDYDSFGNLRQKIDDYGNENRTVEYVYNRLNQQYQVIAFDPNDPNDPSSISYQITTYEYDKNGNVEKIIYPDEKFVQYEYNLQNKVWKETKRDGSEIYYGYWWSGNLWFESDDPDGPDGYPTLLTEFEYNGAGDLISAYKEVNGSEVSNSTFTYNGFGARTSETVSYDDSAITKTTSWTYDGSGNRRTQTHGNTVLSYTHDGLGRIRTIDKGDAEIVSYGYMGKNTQSIHYPAADITEATSYDELGRIERIYSVEDANQVILDFIYTYDSVGNRDSVKYNHLSTPVYDLYYYDTLNRLWGAEYGQYAGFSLATEGIENAEGIHLASLADAMSKWLDTSDVTGYQNKNKGNVRKSVSHAYPASESASINRLSALNTANNPYIAELIQSVKSAKSVAYHNPDAPLLTLAEFGKTASTGYKGETCRDGNGNIIAQVFKDRQDRIVLSAVYPANGDIVVITVRYDNNGGIASKVMTVFDENGSLSGSLDMLANRSLEELLACFRSESTSLLSATSGDMMLMSSTPEELAYGSETFIYDHLGNRSREIQKDGYTRVYSRNSVNQYTGHESDAAYSDKDYVYDDNGNLLNPGYWSNCSYDYRNRLSSVQGYMNFAYDALGRRISKADPYHVPTNYFYDPQGRVIAEYRGDSLDKEFVFGNGQTEVLAMFTPFKDADPNDIAEHQTFMATFGCYLGQPCYNPDFDYNGDGFIYRDDLLYFSETWDLYPEEARNWYYLHDVLGSVCGLIEADELQGREFYGYDVYGGGIYGGASRNPYLFAGNRFDDEIGFYHTHYRTYDPETGRWLQFDPIGYVDGMNLYAYVAGSPAMYYDPLGLYGDKLYEKIWEATKDAAVFLGASVYYLPNAYWETAKSGEQVSSLCGCVDTMTDTLNPLGGGTSMGPQYGQNQAYRQGELVGAAGGMTMNAVVFVAGVHGTVVGVQSLMSSGGCLVQMAQIQTASGAIVPVVAANGKAVIATAETLNSLGLVAATSKNAADALKEQCKSQCDSGTLQPEKVNKPTKKELKQLRNEFNNKTKPEYWKNEAQKNPNDYSPENLNRMRQGNPPIGPDGYPIELHHKTPLSEGGRNSIDNLRPMTRTQHRLRPNYRENH